MEDSLSFKVLIAINWRQQPYNALLAVQERYMSVEHRSVTLSPRFWGRKFK